MSSNDNILSALNSIDPESVDYDGWLRVGMALKKENFPCSVWDDWSSRDLTKYRPGVCASKWDTFNREDANAVGGGTIIQMAKDMGWVNLGEALDWNSEIEDDGDGAFSGFSEVWQPTEQLITYLETLFDSNDLVGYVTNDVWPTDDGWKPSKGVYDRTAKELIDSLKRHPDDIGATVGDWKKDTGAWIRINPLDGKGVKNTNVTKFNYVLVESDSVPIQEQDAIYRKLELPIAALVHSGGKSLHAIVHIDASDYDEYRERVEFLYDFLKDNGLEIDRQDRNPSRLSRMPGITRNGNRQYLAATNIGRKSWNDWMDFVEGVTDHLPDMVPLSEYKDNPPELPEEQIEGILRHGHKMLVSGASKSGKSFLLMELCVCLAEGIEWLGFQCKESKVLYINLEIDPASAIDRFFKIYEKMGVEPKHMDNIITWNLRGKATPMDELATKLIRRIKDQQFDAVVLDPIYKVITGDENNASDMGAFCNQFDRICAEAGCSLIYCHHHSKGAQGNKRAMDRASGSGVFARDPDAQLDVINLQLSDDIVNNVIDDYATGWRMESNLREFRNIKPVNFWFEYPIHKIDETGLLEQCNPEGSTAAIKEQNAKNTNTNQRKTDIDNAYAALMFDPPVTVKGIAEYLGKVERTVRDWIKEFPDDYWIERGVVGKKSAEEIDRSTSATGGGNLYS